MKDLITSVAAVTVLMVFVMQFATNQVTSAKILAADRAVENYRLMMQQDAETNENRLKSQLAEVLGCDEHEVSVERENFSDRITFGVKAPLKNVIACGEFLGISEKENAAHYKSAFEVQP